MKCVFVYGPQPFSDDEIKRLEDNVYTDLKQISERGDDVVKVLYSLLL